MSLLPSLPKWNDPAAVSSYIVSAAGSILAVVALVHPGFHESVTVEAVVASVAAAAAAVSQFVNIITHRSAHAKVGVQTAKVAGILVGKTTPTLVSTPAAVPPSAPEAPKVTPPAA